MNIPSIFAQASSDALNSTASSCTINGQPASCSEAGGMAAIILIPMLLIGIVLFVFWVKSLIHVLKHNDVPNHTLWLILHFIGLGLLTGVIYQFAVKRPYDRAHAAGGQTAQFTGAGQGQQMPPQPYGQPQFTAAPPQAPQQAPNPQYQPQPQQPQYQQTAPAQQPPYPQATPGAQPPQPPNQNTPGQF